MMTRSRFTDFRFARRFRMGNRALQILLGLSLILAINFLAARYFTRVDLTESGIYTLSPETKAYLSDLTEPVHIIITIPKDPESPELVQIHSHLDKLLREYEAFGRRGDQAMVRVEFVDIYRQRKRAEELANTYGLTQENVILVAMGDRSSEIRQANLYEVNEGEIRGFQGEKAITSAILEVASSEMAKIYFLVGHGEMRLDDVDPLRGLSQMESFLRERNFSLATLDLALEAQVPADADLIVLPSPQASLRPEEVEKLRRYMSERNGRMIVLLDPGRRHGLDDLFYDWGVLVDDMVVVDRGPDFSSQGGDLIIRRFAEHPITKLLVDYQITALFGLPRPVRTDPAAVNNERLQVTQLIGSSDQSWGEVDFRTQSPIVFDAARDLPGPISIATVSTRSASSALGITIPGGRLVVFGNSDFIANNRIRAFGNRTLFINSVNWALTRQNLLNIPTRPLESYQVVMSQSDLTRLVYFYSALPASAALFGLLVFFIRRR